MSGKVKMRCARCGKPFKSANAKQVYCPDCEQKERAARAATKGAAVKPAVAAPVLVSKPKIVGAGAHILDPNAPPPPAEAPSSAPTPAHSAGTHTAHAPAPAPDQAKIPAQTTKPVQQPKTKGAPAKGVAPERVVRPKKEQPRPYQLGDEQRAAVEARYLELAQPLEYDGIRSQIAAELGVPKSAVKRAVLDLRRRLQMPSWWELQAYTGTPEDLERIREAYIPLLPIPEVGVHRRLAEQLGLDPAVVYQGIRRIRAEMHLPQYNPPEAHEAGAASETSAAPALAESAADAR